MKPTAFLLSALAALPLGLCLSAGPATATTFAAGETPEQAIELGYRWVRGTVISVERRDTNWAGRALRPGQTHHRVTLDITRDYSKTFGENRRIVFSHSCDASTPCIQSLDVGASEYFNLYETGDHIGSTHFGGVSGGRMTNILGSYPEGWAAESGSEPASYHPKISGESGKSAVAD